jgi:WhiB family redox-sensing transcriptional regulator
MTVATLARTVPTAATAVTTGGMDWYGTGSCNGLDTEIFYLPEGIRGPSKRAREAQAKAVCGRCPVATQCLNWALASGELYGVWGGTTPEERETLIPVRSAG